MADVSSLVEHCFRHEYGRLVAVLTRALGVRHLELVEDVVQASLAKAIQSWGRGGVPDNPTSWLYRTARNLAIDALRRSQTEQRVAAELSLEQRFLSSDAGLSPGELEDAPLRLLFLCCHPTISLESSVALALKTVSGFSTDEVAAVLLITKSNAEKRVARAKDKLRACGVELAELNPHSMASRLEAVQAAIYLLFSEGYSSTAGDLELRRDLCEEAIRLARMLLRVDTLSHAATAALLALMLMHSARFDARFDTHGAIVLLESQDRTRWDWQRVREAMKWMERSTESNELSRFHIESAIAWEHCRAASFEQIDWARVVYFYQMLDQWWPGPMIRLNAAIAASYASGPETGLRCLIEIPEADRCRLRPWWDCAVAETHSRLGNASEAIAHWTDAMSLATNEAHRNLIARKLEKRTKDC